MNRAEKRRQKKLAQKAARNAKSLKPASPSPGQQTQAIQQSIDLAVQHHTAGRLPEAESIYQQILQADPNQLVALHLLGVIAHQVGKNDVAVDHITKAISIKPDYADAHSNLGKVRKDLGQLDEAAASCHKALAIKPNFAEAQNTLGNVLQDLGQLDEAAASYRKALAIKSDYAEAHCNLGINLLKMGQPIPAFKYFRKAISIDFTNGHYWHCYAQCLEHVSFTSFEQSLSDKLLYMLEQKSVMQKRVAKAITTTLRHHPTFTGISKLIQLNTLKNNINDTVKQLARIPLLLKLMELTPINDAELEQILTQIRRAILQESMDNENDSTIQPFHAALAVHCYHNEYLFFESAEE